MFTLDLDDNEKYSNTTLPKLQELFCSQITLVVRFEPGDATSYKHIFTTDPDDSNMFYVGVEKFGTITNFVYGHCEPMDIITYLELKNPYTQLAVSWFINAIQKYSFKTGLLADADTLIQEYQDALAELRQGKKRKKNENI